MVTFISKKCKIRGVKISFNIKSQVIIVQQDIGNISINAPTVSISTNFTVAGVSTFSGNVILPDNGEIKLGESADAKLRHDGYRTILRQHGDLLF